MAVPVGAIAIWTGTLANIPANWLLCDGTSGTPNLVAKFIRGAPASTNPGTTGGADSHGHASMTAAGSHTHTTANDVHSHTVNSAGSHGHGTQANRLGGSANTFKLKNAGAHVHATGTATHSHTMDTYGNHIHTINTADGRPPYYEVAYIQAAAGAAVATGIIII